MTSNTKFQIMSISKLFINGTAFSYFTVIPSWRFCGLSLLPFPDGLWYRLLCSFIQPQHANRTAHTPSGIEKPMIFSYAKKPDTAQFWKAKDLFLLFFPLAFLLVLIFQQNIFEILNFCRFNF